MSLEEAALRTAKSSEEDEENNGGTYRRGYP